MYKLIYIQQSKNSQLCRNNCAFSHYEKNIQFLVLISNTSYNINGYSSNSQNKICTKLICGNKMRTRWNRIFIADLIACSTCFGHHYAHHQELDSIIQVVAACGIWCFGFQVVGMVWSWGLCVRFTGCCPQTGHITLSSTTWKPKHQIPQAAIFCIILSSSWWWA